MTENEIRKTVKNLKQCIVENYKDTPVRFSAVSSADIKTLLDLAEAYLAIEGWPEEKETCEPDKPSIESWKHGFNDSLHLCKLAAMKEKLL